MDVTPPPPPPTTDDYIATYLADKSLTHSCDATLTNIQPSDVVAQQDGSYTGTCPHCGLPFVIPAFVLPL